MTAERTAVVLGGTGLVGGQLVDLLLDDPAYGRVVALGRRPVDRQHAQLEQRVPSGTESHEDAFDAADVFCALGTTLRTAGSRAAFRAVDHDLVVRAAATAAAGGAGRFLLVSSSGASVRSPFFYGRVKAEAEIGVAEQALPSVSIFRPSLLLGERAERRPGEALAQRVAAALSPVLVGPLRRVRAVSARTVARAMLAVAGGTGPGSRVRVVENHEILELGSR